MFVILKQFNVIYEGFAGGQVKGRVGIRVLFANTSSLCAAPVSRSPYVRTVHNAQCKIFANHASRKCHVCYINESRLKPNS